MLRCGESAREVLGGGLSGLPVVQEELLEVVHRVGADAVEDVAKVSEGVDLDSFAGLDEAGEDVGVNDGIRGGVNHSDGKGPHPTSDVL